MTGNEIPHAGPAIKALLEQGFAAADHADIVLGRTYEWDYGVWHIVIDGQTVCGLDPGLFDGIRSVDGVEGLCVTCVERRPRTAEEREASKQSGELADRIIAAEDEGNR